MKVAPQPEPPRWPLWLPLMGIACGLLFGLLCVSVVAGVSGRTSGPGITDASTVLVDVSVVVACVLFAGLVTRPRPWHFGLRAAPLRFTAQIAAMGALAYFLFSLAYQAIVQPKNPQKIVEDIGADTNTLLLIVGALVVIVVAPVCEELFFRGVLFRVLRQRIPFWPAAVADGILFGLVHWSPVILPVLAVLGIMFCYVYERTGSIFPTIALHSLNNTIAYGATTDNGWGPAAAVGALVLAGCVVGVMRTPRGEPAGATSPA
jgi:membrane protease YdiL (CAAX protease family)